MIQIRTVTDFHELDEKIINIKKYDGIFFTSSNSVKIFFDRLIEKNINYNGRIYAVGEKSGQRIKSYGYDVSFIPEKFSSDSLIGSLGKNVLNGKNFLFPKGNLSGTEISDKLKGIANVDEVVVYENVKPDIRNISKLGELIHQKVVDCIAFFSPSAIDNFMELVNGNDISEIDVAVIGNTTLMCAEKYGLNVRIIPDISDAENLAEAIIKYYRN